MQELRRVEVRIRRMLTESYIVISDARFYACHGVGEQERKVGAEFTVSVRVGYDVTRAMDTDDVGDTLSYAKVYKVVRRQMAIPSRLLEHVAARIARALRVGFPGISSIAIKIRKDNPPMGAHCAGAGVDMVFRYDGDA